MTIAKTVESYLTDRDVHFDVVAHPYTASATTTAQAAHVPGNALAKAVLLRDSDGFLMAVLPATHELELDAVERRIGHDVKMATENDIVALFDDCDVGAIPPLGEAYGLRVLWDPALENPAEVYFEGGDHRHVVQVNHDDFLALMTHGDRATVSHHT